MTAAGIWCPAYVGAGSNLDDPIAQLRRALAALEALPGIAAFVRSGLYRSAPLGPPGQPDYVNATAAFLTRLEPRILLGRLRDLEDAQGRTRGERWGPRTLDLDLLVYGRVTSDDAELSLPHPRMQERNFVLLPLAEIAPHLHVPGRGSVLRLLAAVADGGPRIERLHLECE